jgi:hypothetical protein
VHGNFSDTFEAVVGTTVERAVEKEVHDVSGLEVDESDYLD